MRCKKAYSALHSRYLSDRKAVSCQTKDKFRAISVGRTYTQSIGYQDQREKPFFLGEGQDHKTPKHHPKRELDKKYGKPILIPTSCVIELSSLITWVCATKNHHGPEPWQLTIQLQRSEMLVNKFSDFFFILYNVMLLQLYVICNLIK